MEHVSLWCEVPTATFAWPDTWKIVILLILGFLTACAVLNLLCQPQQLAQVPLVGFLPEPSLSLPSLHPIAFYSYYS